MTYLLAVCNYLKVDPDRVLVYRVEGDQAVLIVDNGIKGCPKYQVPLSRLQPDLADNARSYAPVGQYTEVKPTQTGKRRAR